jgi:ferredoxin
MAQQNELRIKAKELLTTKKVDVIIGYGTVETNTVNAVFITDPNDAEKLVWNDECKSNLTVYLRRPEIKKYGKVGIVLKGCDAKTLAVLEIEKQLDRENIVAIGMGCHGIQELAQLQNKCECCDVQNPPNCDIVIEKPNTRHVSHPQGESRYAKVERLMALSQQERWEYWKKELSRCIKCYACRQNCPLCYCNTCVVDKNRPVRIDTSATLKGNFAWNILRAFHLAGRCIGCSSCASSCPASIDLDILNLCLAKAAEEQFHFRAGYDPKGLPLIGSFSPEDHEEFIR